MFSGGFMQENNFFEVDFMTIVIEKKAIEFEKHISADPIINVLVLPTLKTFPDYKGFYKKFYENSDLIIFVQSFSYEITLRGSYFLNSDARENIENLLSLLDEYEIKKHFTRVDFQITKDINYQVTHKEIKKSITDLKIYEYSQKKEYETFKAYNSTTSILLYHKTKQLQTLAKKKRFKPYIQKYQKKYEGGNNVRLEVCFRSKSEFIINLNNEIKYPEYSFEQFKELKKIKFSKKFLNIIKNGVLCKRMI